MLLGLQSQLGTLWSSVVDADTGLALGPACLVLGGEQPAGEEGEGLSPRLGLRGGQEGDLLAVPQEAALDHSLPDNCNRDV